VICMNDDFTQNMTTAAFQLLPDANLVGLVNHVEQQEHVAIPVTLIVGGCVVSGHLIPRAEWYNRTGELIEVLDRQGGPGYAAEFRGLAVDRMVAQAIGDDEHLNPLVRHQCLHLRGATVWQAGKVLIDGTLWRVLCSQVEGWMISTISSSDD
jgi:hypothetical protein